MVFNQILIYNNMEIITDDIKRIRAEYIDIDNKIKELHIKRCELSEQMRYILGNNKDKVEEIYEYMMRKNISQVMSGNCNFIITNI